MPMDRAARICEELTDCMAPLNIWDWYAALLNPKPRTKAVKAGILNPTLGRP